MTTPDPACSARAPLTSFDDHPLEIFPWARRIPQSPLRDLAYTLVFNTLIAATFTVLSLVFNAPARSWGAIAWSNFVVSNCIGFVIHAEFVLAERLTGARYRTWTFAQRAVFFSALPIAGTTIPRVDPAMTPRPSLASALSRPGVTGSLAVEASELNTST